MEHGNSFIVLVNLCSRVSLHSLEQSRIIRKIMRVKGVQSENKMWCTQLGCSNYLSFS